MKFSCVYIEEEVRDTPRVQEILERVKDTPLVTIERFGEVFNRKSQNFRLQKSNPALILARKHGRLVLSAPPGYGFNNGPGFYFSHMLNCVYDCRYCFLQGMYRSASYVLFCNYEEFAEQIASGEDDLVNPVYYSGYDCDSLALEPVSKFVDFFVHWFTAHPRLTLEIRTKSTQVRDLLEIDPAKNCVIAMSFTPQEIHRRWEDRVPAIEKRLEALCRLQQQGWPVALRFEPLIYQEGFEQDYRQLFDQVFSRLDAEKLHSVSTGLFRMPKKFYRNIAAIYPDEALFARQVAEHDGLITQPEEWERKLLETVQELIFRYVDKRQYYHCA
jgi:spore photoproduct lyase